MLATPLIGIVTAEPTDGQKVPVTLKWRNVGPTTVVERRDVNGNVSHRIMIQNWQVNLTIGDAVTPIQGTAVGNRQTLYRYTKPGGVDQLAIDYYVISFPTAGGGFEGNTHITLTDWDSVSRMYNVHLHALFHGTGGFEGQTLNTWQIGPGTNFVWEGYLLKP
jgi:hypothetical protein